MAVVFLEDADNGSYHRAELVGATRGEGARMPDGTVVRVVKEATGRRRRMWRSENRRDYYERWTLNQSVFTGNAS